MPAIIRQVLFEATELTPVWARSRPAPEPVVTPAKSAPTKRPRRAASDGTTKPAAASTKGRSSSKPRQTRRTDGRAKGGD
jgi:hypothetical protein